MELRKLFTDERAVSPVVGVALLIAIAVILAAVIGAVVLGLGTASADAPQAQLNLNEDSGAISHSGGDPLDSNEIVVKATDSSGSTTEYYLTSDLAAGERGTPNTVADGSGTDLDPSAFDEISIVWESPDGDKETVLKTWDV